MKKNILSALLLLVCSTVFSQTIKIENGLSFSSMDSKEFHILSENVTNYSFLAGCDYFEHKFYYISSEIGYLQIGGKETNDPAANNTLINIQDIWQYIHLNTTIRFKYQTGNSQLFVGVGPKLEVLVSSNKFTDVIYSNGYEMNKLSPGGKGEIGIVQNINRIRVGLNYSYLVNFWNVGKSLYHSVYSNTSCLMFSIGYKLK